MIEVIRSRVFDIWLSGLRDTRGRARVLMRIERLAAGNPGDHKSIGDGVLELRIAFGPGYRVYYVVRGPVLIILLAGGDKSTQQSDIAKAKAMVAELG